MNTYNFLPEISNLVFLQQLLKNYGFYGNNGTGSYIHFLKFVMKLIWFFSSYKLWSIEQPITNVFKQYEFKW